MPNRPPIHGAADQARRRVAYDKARQADHAFYCSSAWLSVRQEVLVRDCWTCKHCHRTIGGKGEAHVDHIKPRQTHPALALDPENLQVLCRHCHSRKTAVDEQSFGVTR